MRNLLIICAVAFAFFAVIPPHNGGWKVLTALYAAAAVAFALAAAIQ